MSKLYRLTILFLVLITAIPISVAVDEDPTLDGLTGGMSGDAKSVLDQIVMWLVLVGLIASLIYAIAGAMSSNPDQTKKGIHGMVYIVGAVLIYYMAKYAIIYLQTRYG